MEGLILSLITVCLTVDFNVFVSGILVVYETGIKQVLLSCGGNLSQDLQTLS